MFNFRHLKNLQFLNQTFPRAGRSVHVRSLCVLMCVNKFTEESPWEQTNNNLKTKKTIVVAVECWSPGMAYKL